MSQADYVNHMGSDLTVVNAARVSFDKESQWAKRVSVSPEEGYFQDELAQRDKRLIVYLATYGHWTPFAHPQITIRETVPIFVARQRFKHMVGFTYNEVSRRYVDDTPEFFVPMNWRERPNGSVKQGSGDEHYRDHFWASTYETFCNEVLNLYDEMISDGVAPEQARMVLPQSMMTSYYVTGSLAAWARAYKQRIDPHAQVEIQDLAKQWDMIIRPLYPTSWKELTV